MFVDDEESEQQAQSSTAVFATPTTAPNLPVVTPQIELNVSAAGANVAAAAAND